MLQYPDFLARVLPTKQEALFAILVGGFATMIIFAYTDIVIHDNFVLLIVAGCYESSTDEICEKARELGDCEIGDQMCLGLKYWNLLPLLVLFVAIGFGIGRMFFGVIGGAKINGMLLLVGGAWFVTALILPYFGWGDFIYFIIKGDPIPEKLPWLNDAGFLTMINFGSDPDMVEKIDLYGVMGVGLGILITMWYGLTHLHNKELLGFLE